MAKEEKVVKVVSAITSHLGSIAAIICSVTLIVGWALCGPMFGFSETWQLVINTGTTIITFLMVFIIQNTQNRDGRAIQTKLDAILDAVYEHTDPDLLHLEEMPEKDIAQKHEEVTTQST